MIDLDKILQDTDVTEPQVRRMCRFMQLEMPPKGVTAEIGAMVIVFDWLLKKGLQIDQAYGVLDAVRDDVLSYVAANSHELVTIQLLDGLYVAYGNHRQVYYIASGEMVELDELPVESVCLNLTVILHRFLNPLEGTAWNA